jgi:hypothetical protein
MTTFHVATSSATGWRFCSTDRLDIPVRFVAFGTVCCADEFTAPAFKSATRGSHQKRERLVLDGFSLAFDDVVAQLDAFITDEHVRPGYEMPNLGAGLAAERTELR